MDLVLNVLAILFLVIVCVKVWMLIANYVGHHFKFGEIITSLLSKLSPKGKTNN